MEKRTKQQLKELSADELEGVSGAQEARVAATCGYRLGLLGAGLEALGINTPKYCTMAPTRNDNDSRAYDRASGVGLGFYGFPAERRAGFEYANRDWLGAAPR